jgi:hypothetical protein
VEVAEVILQGCRSVGRRGDAGDQVLESEGVEGIFLIVGFASDPLQVGRLFIDLQGLALEHPIAALRGSNLQGTEQLEPEEGDVVGGVMGRSARKGTSRVALARSSP